MTTPDPIAAVTTGSTTPTGSVTLTDKGRRKLGALPVEADEAKAIGTLYRKVRASMVEGVRCLIEVGARLKAMKDSLDRGQWGTWLAANAAVLGFGQRTAQMLIKIAANPKLASDWSEADALQISREIWGHHQRRLPKPEQRDDDPEAGEPVSGDDSEGKVPAAKTKPAPRQGGTTFMLEDHNGRYHRVSKQEFEAASGDPEASADAMKAGFEADDAAAHERDRHPEPTAVVTVPDEPLALLREILRIVHEGCVRPAHSAYEEEWNGLLKRIEGVLDKDGAS